MAGSLRFHLGTCDWPGLRGERFARFPASRRDRDAGGLIPPEPLCMDGRSLARFSFLIP
jgi:hypothetical protein